MKVQYRSPYNAEGLEQDTHSNAEKANSQEYIKGDQSNSENIHASHEIRSMKDEHALNILNEMENYPMINVLNFCWTTNALCMSSDIHYAKSWFWT
jgi:adenosine/AMP kinase